MYNSLFLWGVTDKFFTQSYFPKSYQRSEFVSNLHLLNTTCRFSVVRHFSNYLTCSLALILTAFSIIFNFLLISNFFPLYKRRDKTRLQLFILISLWIIYYLLWPRTNTRLSFSPCLSVSVTKNELNSILSLKLNYVLKDRINVALE